MKKILLSVLTLMILASCEKDAEIKTLNRNQKAPISNVTKGDETFITTEEAVNIAKKFVIAEGILGPNTKGVSVNYNMAYTDLGDSPTTKASSKSPAYYIYNLNDKGYIIVSAHKAANPILGFSINGAFDSKKIPEGLVSVLDSYSKGINKARELGVKPNVKTAVARAEFLSPSALTKREYPAVKPILGNIQWNQSPYYNELCPNGAPVGCVATAAAQIMRYWKYPKKSQGAHSYSASAGSYDYLGYDYNRDWNWDAMPEACLTESNREVAELSYAVAISVDMVFSPEKSSAFETLVPDAMKKYFNYPSTIEYIHRNKYSSAHWVKILQKELQAGRPMEYIGGGTGGAHAFVCDGYHSKGYFHFNWGWGGMSDGYFLLNALNPGSSGIVGDSDGFNDKQGAVIGFAPPDGWNNDNDNN